MNQLLDSGWVNSGGSVNHVTSHIVRAAIDSGLQARHLEHLQAAYRERLLAMESALEREFTDLARWERPDGGYFFWLEMTGREDTSALRPAALAAGSGFIPGPLFTAGGGFESYLRLSFAHYDERQIVTGVRRLAEVVRHNT
jgi:DNA-binding transcriptional MocR family regulator